MNNIFQNKKLLILGGNPETGALVQEANNLGLLTIVVDPNPEAPAKKFAYRAYNVDGMDIDEIVRVAKSEQVNGVLVGVADILVPSYVEVCERLNLPCYATRAIVEAFSSKDGFIQLCKDYNVPTTPNYEFHEGFSYQDIDYPVMVKPVDSGAGVGMKICKNRTELEEGIDFALFHSKKKRVVVERYMECEDSAAYFTFENGKIYLSVMFDRYTTDKQGNSSPVCIATEYPSKYTALFLEKTFPKIKEMFESIQIKNGVLCIQFFVEDGKMYAYDPGFRLQGEGPHIYLKKVNDFDHREMLIRFAMTGKLYEGNFVEKNDPLLSGKFAMTLLVLLKSGVITEISGWEAIKRHTHVIDHIQRFKVGNLVTKEMVGTERQVFARIYVVGESREQLKETAEFIHSTLEIYDENHTSMIVDRYYPS